MRKPKEVDWLHVSFASYSLKDFYEDVPMIRLVSNYVKLTRNDDITTIYEGTFIKNEIKHHVKVAIDRNSCSIDDKEVNPEEFVEFFEGSEKDPVPIIKEITGVDHDDYLTDVEYSDGTVEIFEVKGKCLLPFGLPKKS